MSLTMDSIIGHRGIAALAPENTLAGIHKAAEAGVKWVELDVTLLADESAIMFHDPDVGRTTNGKGYLKSLGLSDIQFLDAGSWFGEGFKNERIPALAEMLELIKALGLSLNLELKPNQCDVKTLVEVVVGTLNEVDFPLEQLLVSSFNHNALIFFRELSGCRIGCLFECLPGDWKQKARQVAATTIHLNVKKLSKKDAEAVKSEGYELYCYTVNDKKLAEKIKEWGVDGVFSDCPGDL